jgi:hypothetical protein
VNPLWLALLQSDVGTGAAATAAVRGLDDRPAGVLCLWHGSDRPHEAALQADPRIHDSQGPECVVSLALAASGSEPIADDPAIVEARRAVLRDGRPCAVSLLSADPVSVAGALTVAHADRADQVAALRDDPFARLFTARLLHVAGGVLGTLVRPTGPSLERYAGRPWPYDRF